MASLLRFSFSVTIFRSFLRHFSSIPLKATDDFVGSSSPSRSRDVANSVSYRRSMLRPPTSVRLSKRRLNLCSLIGTVATRFKRLGGKGGVSRACAFLEVKSDHLQADSSCFRVWLRLQGKQAEIALQHLKPNDFIYVSGSLGFYEKPNANGQHETFFKVYVKDLNYVRRLDAYQRTMTTAGLEARGLLSSPSEPERELADRLHLWQIFFASPNEWWDNRSSKKHPLTPDFKHKNTKESLWLTPDDPPWVIQQLELYDSNITGRRRRDADAWLDSHEWKFDGFD